MVDGDGDASEISHGFTFLDDFNFLEPCQWFNLCRLRKAELNQTNIYFGSQNGNLGAQIQEGTQILTH